ncbi:MAG: S53 family peptidase, partial [archaeon]|nr:S53 family peptidase [archaeon]
GNAPVISSLYPSSEEFTLFFLPRCSDGSTQQGSAQCSPEISSWTVTVSFGVVPKQVSSMITPQQASCKPCAAFTGHLAGNCQNTIAQYGHSSQTVFCQSPVIGPIPNYIQLTPSIATSFSSGLLSAAGIYPFHNVFLGEFMSPQVLRARYGVPDGLYGRAPSNSMSVAEFLGQFYNPEDLHIWHKIMGLPAPAPVILIGPNNATEPGGEASLGRFNFSFNVFSKTVPTNLLLLLCVDIQYIMGIAPNITTTFWSLGQLTNGQEPFLDWITDILNSPNPPLVHSVSYADDEPSLSVEYMNRVDIEFIKAGARGLSLFFAAGDNGVAASDPSAPGCPGRFVPSFPSSSPHVTTVSGTQWSTQATPLCNLTGDGGTLSYQCSTVQEIASSTLTGSRISTGGGFSDVFPRPSYQDAWVKAYLVDYIDKKIPQSWYNASGRCYGDISSSARNYPTMIGGELDSVDGTSAATPTIAALVALINDVLLSSGRPPVGFINPALYSMPNTHFFDVVLGNNKCPEDLQSCCPYGYDASPFFDPLSGRGTPHFSLLLDFFQKL